MPKSFLNSCISELQKDSVKQELRKILKPLVDIVLKDLYPYLYLSISFIFICFILILGIFFQLMRINKRLHLIEK
tara:strand:+ start:17506 stop:17730 length:225 start_codon:yes stop_codon:yes gene_type:complete